MLACILLDEEGVLLGCRNQLIMIGAHTIL